MIGVSKLLLGAESESDGLRYLDVKNGSILSQISHHGSRVKGNKPIVVWNMTNQCNLNCLHCYAKATKNASNDEFTTEEAKALMDDVAKYNSPVFLFSGGEPFMRRDLIELIEYANSINLRPVISTNGTLITKEKAIQAKKAGVKYIGVSLDGMAETNDKFRGLDGAFEMAIKGMKNCLSAGIKTGLRFTISKHNRDDLPLVLLKLKEIGINRCCVYHLDYSGRGVEIAKDDLSHAETRQALDTYFNLTRFHHKNGFPVETLLVGNYADAGYLYLKLLEEDPDKAEHAYELLKRNGGDGTGETIACVDHQGNVYANQFWRDHSFGNVKERAFGDIWDDVTDPIMAGLKNKANHITGRCSVDNCRFFELCKGGSRVRAQSVDGDVWGPDPACYLTDEEIEIK